MRRAVLVLLVSPLIGCAYDWTVGPADAHEDPREDERRVADAKSDVVEERAPLTDADCNAMVDKVAVLMGDIDSCDAACADHVPGFCGCELPVQNSSTAAVKKYLASLSQFGDSGCVDCSVFQCNPVKFTCVQGICR